MAAYSAVISLLQTLEQRNPELFHGQTAETLDSLHATAEYFYNVLEEANNKSRFEPDKIKSLEEKIRVAANDAEHVVELKIGRIKGSILRFGISHIILHRNLLSVVKNMDSTKKEVMEIVSNVDDQILELSGDSLIGTSSRSNPMLHHLEDNIVQGLDDDLQIIVTRLTTSQSDLDTITISGMGGIGKTTLARMAYDHLRIRYHFDIRVWVTISQQFRSRNMLLDVCRCISNQANIVIGKDYDKKDDDELADLVQKKLKGRRYLVVVDDIWSTKVWDSIKGIFPECNNRSRILLTTRETEVAMYANPASPHEMKLLNLDNSWKLLRDKVFGPKHDHPQELEKIGKKIVEKCQGLPLTIAVIAGHLSKVASTLETWKDIFQTLGEIVASHPDKCLGVLGLSYHHLPNHLKPCFLSMACFPEDFQVETSRLIQLWISEGFIGPPRSGKRLEEVAEEYLEDLISRNLIMAKKRRFNGEIKACGIMHDLLHEFCLIEAEMTKFMHIARTYPTLPIAKHNVRLFSFQTQYYSVDDFRKHLTPVARSMYLFSRLRPHSETRYNLLEMPIHRFNLLRVLSIFHEEFPSFPLEITKLFHLRYLEIRFIGKVPASISKLQNLQTLILRESKNTDLTLSRKIWMMTNLRHIHLRGSCYLPSPRRERIRNKHVVIGMPNLQELSGLCFTSCTNEVFSGIPNLKRLVINRSSSRIKDPTNRLIDMSSLTKLEELKCVNYTSIMPWVFINWFVFPTSLKRLTLVGYFGFPWEDISSTLVMLPNLEELKLTTEAVSGEVWRLSDEDKFQSLKLLVLSELNLWRWEANSDSFPKLERLVLKKCKNLKEIPTDFGEICTLESIQLYKCNTHADNSARKIGLEQEDMGNNCLKVYIRSRHCKKTKTRTAATR